MYNYVYDKQYYCNCPVHDSPSFSRLAFTKTLEEAQQDILNEIQEYKTDAIYDSNIGEIVSEVLLSYHSHSVATVTFKNINTNTEIKFKPDPYNKGKWVIMED